MIPITQTRTGERGNCMRACLASILELPLAVVPEFDQRTDELFYADINRWLRGKALEYRQVPLTVKPIGYSTIEGASPRGGQHGCVAKDGVLVWDPHPLDGTGRGLVEPQRYGLLLPLESK
jgi:hypothetical protein